MNRLRTVLLCLLLGTVILMTGQAMAMPDGPGQVIPPALEVVPSAPVNCQIVGIVREPMITAGTTPVYMYHIFCMSVGDQP